MNPFGDDTMSESISEQSSHSVAEYQKGIARHVCTFDDFFVDRFKAKMAPKTMPQDSFVTDGKSKTKDRAQFC